MFAAGKPLETHLNTREKNMNDGIAFIRTSQPDYFWRKIRLKMSHISVRTSNFADVIGKWCWHDRWFFWRDMIIVVKQASIFAVVTLSFPPIYGACRGAERKDVIVIDLHCARNKRYEGKELCPERSILYWDTPQYDPSDMKCSVQPQQHCTWVIDISRCGDCLSALF